MGRLIQISSCVHSRGLFCGGLILKLCLLILRKHCRPYPPPPPPPPTSKCTSSVKRVFEGAGYSVLLHPQYPSDGFSLPPPPPHPNPPNVHHLLKESVWRCWVLRTSASAVPIWWIVPPHPLKQALWHLVQWFVAVARRIEEECTSMPTVSFYSQAKVFAGPCQQQNKGQYV